MEGIRELCVLPVQLLCVQNYLSIKNDFFFNDVLSSTTSQCFSCIQGPRNFPELAHKLQQLNPVEAPEGEREQLLGWARRQLQDQDDCLLSPKRPPG